VRLRAQTLECVLEPRELVKIATGVLKAKSTDEAFVDMCARRLEKVKIAVQIVQICDFH